MFQSIPYRPLARRVLTSKRSQRFTSSWTNSTISSIRTALTSRSPKIIDDYLTPTPSNLLSLSLFSASTPQPPIRPPSSACPTFGYPLPYGSHLIHFPIRATPTELFPDGTDADHLPHGSVPKRMWEGGEVRYREGWREEMRMDGRRAVCIEEIGDVRVARNPGQLLVDVWRRYGVVKGDTADVDRLKAARNVAIEERRTLVFMAEDTAVGGPRDRVVKCPYKAEFSQSFIPSALMLFNFSALTYNAHKIHYASGYDGFDTPVVHGPLTQALMLHTITSSLPECDIESLEYSNLAPLVADEKLTVSLSRRDDNLRVWISGPTGGMAVKATAKLTS